MDLATLLITVFVCIACLAGGIAIGYWLWGNDPKRLVELQEKHEKYQDDVNVHMSQMLTAVDDLRTKIRRSASELGDPVSDGKVEREDNAPALETAMPKPALALDGDVAVQPTAEEIETLPVDDTPEATEDAPAEEAEAAEIQEPSSDVAAEEPEVVVVAEPEVQTDETSAEAVDAADAADAVEADDTDTPDKKAS